MEIKFTKAFLNKLESLMSVTGYVLRYEKGSFKSGFCLLRDMKVAIVNKFFTLEGRVTALIDIIKELEVDEEQLNPEEKKLYTKIMNHSSKPSTPES